MQFAVNWILVTGAAAVAICVSMFILYAYLSHKTFQKPDNSPSDYLKCGIPGKRGKVVVCIGDSITHGRVSYNYVELLSSQIKDKGYDVINAGLNNELAYNALRRIDDIVACKPSHVTVLIGTNDVRARLSEKQAQWAQKKMKLPRRPDEAFFTSSLMTLCSDLKSRTQAKIGLLSLPPIGEDITHPAFGQAVHYSRCIKNIALAQGVGYLPLNERMAHWLKSHGDLPGISFDQLTIKMYAAVFQHFILNWSFSRISSQNGYCLLTDSVHLNDRAAEMICALIREFIND